MRKLKIARESWPIAGTFTISRGSKTAADVVVVKLEEDGIQGRGECVPYTRYQETVEGVIDALESARTRIETSLNRAEFSSIVAPKAARNALDCALWDLEAKIKRKPVWQLAGLPEPKPLVTAYTLSLDTPQAMAAAAAKAASRPLLKLKLGRDGDTERLQAIRKAAPDSRLIVDANEGWTPDNLAQMLEACAAARVELIEQPLPAADDEALRHVAHLVPICADESAHGVDSLPGLAGKYDVINIKLDKTGGLTEALKLGHAAKAHGLGIMTGCMLGTSLAMAPAFLVAQLGTVVDLDGPLLLQKDREPGIRYEKSLMFPPPTELWG